VKKGLEDFLVCENVARVKFILKKSAKLILNFICSYPTLTELKIKRLNMDKKKISTVILQTKVITSKNDHRTQFYIRVRLCKTDAVLQKTRLMSEEFFISKTRAHVDLSKIVEDY
jgi:hypothetical protein